MTWPAAKGAFFKTPSVACVVLIISTICACANGRNDTQLRQVVKELGIPVNSQPADYREIHIALLTGLLCISA
ncbi:hypothetical protein ACNKHM_27915 [Shigella sonnei]